MKVEIFIKNSSLPYYLQIKEIIKERIMENIYPVDTLIPSENVLSQEFNVTRATIRSALTELKKQGLIRTEKGKGSVVCHPVIEQSLLRFYSFGRDFMNSSYNTKTTTISKKEVLSPWDVASKLELTENDLVFEIIRLRWFNEFPLIIETSYLPIKLFPNLFSNDLEGQSIYDLIEYKYGIKIIKAKEYISPKNAAVDESDYLGIEEGAPVFFTERITVSSTQKPIELRRSIIRGDKYTFYTELY